METLFSMMDKWLNNNSLESVIATALGTRISDKTVTQKIEDGWKIKTTKIISTDGYTYTYISKVKLDGTHNEYSEKKERISKEKLQEMELEAVKKRDYEIAAKYKTIIDAMK